MIVTTTTIQDMANFVTAEDKRIYDLTQENSPTLNMFLPIDISGNTSAHRISLQQIINLAAGSSPKQDANAGPTNPDNANGNIGDFYFKVPADGSSITMFKKISGGTFGTWATVFNLPLADVKNTVKKIPFTDADFVEVDGSFSLPLPFTGSQISLGLISRAGITDDVPSGDLVNNLSGGQIESYNGLNGGTQYGIVYYVGELL